MLVCKNPFVDDSDLRTGFVRAYNNLITDPASMDRWTATLENGSPLEKLRAKQMLEMAEQGELEEFVDELAQLVILEIKVHGGKDFEYYLMDGSQIRVNLEAESV